MSLAELSALRRETPSHNPENPSADIDPALAFMLAQQAMNRWQFEAERLRLAAETRHEPEEAVRDAQTAMQQIDALAERIRPFSNFVDMAIRFEAQEVLVALDALHTRMSRVVLKLAPDEAWRDPVQVLETLTARRH